MHWYWQDLGWDCYLAFFTNLQQSYGPCFISEFRFHSISLEKIDRIWPIFFVHWYWQDLGWDCYCHFSQICNRVMALDWWQIFVSTQYLENKQMEFDQLILTRSRLGLLPVIFHKLVTELWPLIDVRFLFPFKILRTIKWNEFDQILYMHWYWQDLGWDCLCYLSFFLQICSRVMALDWCQNFVSVHGSGGVLVSRLKVCRFEPQPCHCVVSLSKTHTSLLSTGSSQEDLSWHDKKNVNLDIKNQIKQMFPLNIFRTSGQNFIKFCICLGWDFYLSFFVNLQQSYGPWIKLIGILCTFGLLMYWDGAIVSFSDNSSYHAAFQ